MADGGMAAAGTAERAQGPWPARAERVRKPSVKFSGELLRTILRRVASGETVTAICSEPGMPHRTTVTAWANERATIRKALSRARTLGGWDHERCRRRSSYCEATAMEIYARLCEGESMTRICADPAMPAASTVALWREAHADFDARVSLARRVQAERFCDLGWEIAEAVTPANAYATHVQLGHLRWTAGVLAPKRFGRFKPVVAEATEADLAAAAAEAEAAPQGPREVVYYVRHFKREPQPDGTVKVVAYKQHCATGELVRDTSRDAEGADGAG